MSAATARASHHRRSSSRRPLARRHDLRRRSWSRRPLACGHELRRQAGRARTRWLAALVLAIPVIFVAAFLIGRQESGGPATSFIDLATLGSANFVVFTLLMTSDLLLG